MSLSVLSNSTGSSRTDIQLTSSTRTIDDWLSRACQVESFHAGRFGEAEIWDKNGVRAPRATISAGTELILELWLYLDEDTAVAWIDNGKAIYIFGLKRGHEPQWVIGDDVVVSDSDLNEFGNLPRWQQLKLLEI